MRLFCEVVTFRLMNHFSRALKSLQGQKTSLAFELEYLRKEKEKLEGAITMDKFLLQQTLSQALICLKQQRPDLFTLSGPEQIAMLLKAFLK